ncbi:hypothetical protein At12D1_22250 [Agrobacterium tumefaciens]|nr:hypothetical protein At12D1_22250 [Agrobacterium tumefaciens]
MRTKYVSESCVKYSHKGLGEEAIDIIFDLATHKDYRYWGSVG